MDDQQIQQDSVIVKSRIKEMAELEGKAYNVSSDFLEMLDRKVVSLVKESCRRARDNGRSTVMARDL